VDRVPTNRANPEASENAGADVAADAGGDLNRQHPVKIETSVAPRTDVMVLARLSSGHRITTMNQSRRNWSMTTTCRATIRECRRTNWMPSRKPLDARTWVCLHSATARLNHGEAAVGGGAAVVGEGTEIRIDEAKPRRAPRFPMAWLTAMSMTFSTIPRNCRRLAIVLTAQIN
jgi:hypothetical protein